MLSATGLSENNGIVAKASSNLHRDAGARVCMTTRPPVGSMGSAVACGPALNPAAYDSAAPPRASGGNAASRTGRPPTRVDSSQAWDEMPRSTCATVAYPVLATTQDIEPSGPGSQHRQTGEEE